MMQKIKNKKGKSAQHKRTVKERKQIWYEEKKGNEKDPEFWLCDWAKRKLLPPSIPLSDMWENEKTGEGGGKILGQGTKGREKKAERLGPIVSCEVIENK